MSGVPLGLPLETSEQLLTSETQETGWFVQTGGGRKRIRDSVLAAQLLAMWRAREPVAVMDDEEAVRVAPAKKKLAYDTVEALDVLAFDLF